MKFFKIVILFAFIALIAFPSFIKAQTTSTSTEKTNQYYSVVFDKELEAAVTAKLTYVNSTQDPIKNIALEIPGTSVRIISIVQVGREDVDECSRYKSNMPQTVENCLTWSNTSLGRATYALVKHDLATDTQNATSLKANVALTQEIASSEDSTLIISYKTKGLANKVWDGYKYAFETIKSNYDIENVRVAIDVNDDLFIKNKAEGTTNFQSDLVAAAPKLSATEFSANATFDTYSSRISSAPGVVKSTSNLDPNENYKVEGKFYNSELMGQLPSLALVVVTFLVIIVVLIIIIKKEKK